MNVPMATPQGMTDIRKAFTIGMLVVGPYTTSKFFAPRAVIYVIQYPQ